jgi:NitT/TauT family transport system ATP-binding protein
MVGDVRTTELNGRQDQSSPEAAGTGRSVVEMRGVSVTFADPDGGAGRAVLSDIDLDVADGDFVVLVGRSGCGKTTMLNALAGLVEPSAGSVRLLDQTPAQARHRVGYMFARDALLPWRTALRNIEYGLEIRGVPRAERRHTAREYLELVGLGDAARRWPWQLSQGMRQRVAIARTLALEPEMLLMDEPFSALDADTREAVQQEFLRLWEHHRRTVVFVTHDLTEAIYLADRILLIAGGGVMDDVTVPFERPRDLDSLTTSPEFTELWRTLRTKLSDAK